MKKFLQSFIAKINENKKNRFWLIPFILLCAWCVDTVFSLFNTGFIKIDAWVIASLTVKCGILSANIFFLINLFLHKKKELFYLFKTYAGYSVIIIYVAYAFPRMTWEMEGLVSGWNAVALWISNFLSTLFPTALYICFWSGKLQTAWGVAVEKEIKALRKKKTTAPESPRKLKDIILENLHVLIQAFIIVIIIQHFFFQLYVIPSESMVPAILINDRPFVTKIQSGPTIPLTNWHLPVLSKPSRGTIVVFESPSYKQDSLFGKVFHHFIFLATLSLVDIDRDNQGEIKKQYIVKRVIGTPGDKLKMIDDAVYIKHAGDDGFKLLEKDKEKYSHVNLFSEPAGIRKEIQDTVINGKTRSLFDRWDKLKNEASVKEHADEIADTAAKIEHILTSRHVSARRGELFDDAARNTSISPDSPVSGKIDILSYYTFRNGIDRQNEIEYLRLLEKENEAAVLREYLATGKMGKSIDTDIDELADYELNGKKLDLMYDRLVLSKFYRYLELSTGPRIASQSPENEILSDDVLSGIIRDIAEFYIYIRFYDYRNFPEFPEGEDSYIPQGSYFLMGDNRYNSLDFRYSHDNFYFRKLDPETNYSFKYPSNLEMSLLDENSILGRVVFRLWPVTRWGLIQ